MKKSIFMLSGLILMILTAAKSPGSGSKTKSEAGITFFEGSWNEALELAKKENKIIFLDISASWCGPCKKLKASTFPNIEVGKYYNTNFINVAVDGEKGEGINLARKYKIKGYPSLIYVDGKEQLIAQTAGYRNPKQLIELGKKVINR
ncbi:MAG: thioredoxin family protein [Prolixibacteraceae bacterium]|jgi:thioredoxin 1|nr:thioredoxin family protein [Prolixibacteraceae bacterium]MBT6004123.1 thioredoxin family protein [Prolixibacteraceae bacterium]MBT6763467.1 thioredoxin family protein [Prolixibacteraceae bacterium]MBT6996884.1 thioredoxin family protein [Prolixibacteraceae bacterium]MBT7394350.1 thioredoxin family protein [Prolixibacteraceae bacterium]